MFSFYFYKKNPTDKIWWVNKVDEHGEALIGTLLVSFDEKKVYNLFKDYPDKFTNEEKRIFDKENPYWAKFFDKKR